MFDFTVRAFNLSEQYRLPVIILADEVIGHMNERVVIPEENRIKVVDRKKPRVPPDRYLPYQADPDGVAPMANCGEGYRIHMTGLTHDERGYPAMDPEAQQEMVDRIVGKIRKNRDKIISTENVFLDDAEVVVVAYGISARSARQAVRTAREQGIRAGLVKLETVWPFPEDLIRSLAPPGQGPDHAGDQRRPDGPGTGALRLRDLCSGADFPLRRIHHPSRGDPSAVQKAVRGKEGK